MFIFFLNSGCVCAHKYAWFDSLDQSKAQACRCGFPPRCRTHSLLRKPQKGEFPKQQDAGLFAVPVLITLRALRRGCYLEEVITIIICADQQQSQRLRKHNPGTSTWMENCSEESVFLLWSAYRRKTHNVSFSLFYSQHQLLLLFFFFFFFLPSLPCWIPLF